MNRESLRKLAAPAILFLFFVLIGLRSEDLLQRFGLEALETARVVLTYGLQIGLWFSAAFLLNRLVNVLFWDGLVSRAVKGRVPRLLRDLTCFAIYAIAATGVTAVVFNRPVTGFWATSGVVGVVLGFALRNIILDVFMGLAINVDRPYAIGDWIMVVEDPASDENLIGCVQEINWRTTRLRTTDNNMLIIPNNVIGQKVVTNFMSPGEESRFELDFELDFSVPSDRAVRVLTAAVQAVAGEHEGPAAAPPPKARVTGITDQGVQYRVRYWITPRSVSPPRARHTVITSILSHLHQAGMQLAYPKRDTYIAGMPKRLHEHGEATDRGELLQRIPWFNALTLAEIGKIAESVLSQTLTRGSTLVTAGESGDSMFVIVEGLCEMFAPSRSTCEEVKVGKLGPADFYGEMSVLTGQNRPVTIRAATDVVVYEIAKNHLEPLLKARPEMAEQICSIVAERKLMTAQALTENEQMEPEEQTRSLAEGILRGMRSFFSGVFQEPQRWLNPSVEEGLGSKV